MQSCGPTFTIIIKTKMKEESMHQKTVHYIMYLEVFVPC